ncbi:MAG TPA: hypothetical protein VMR28_00365 [Candidatus Saccharimonadales bacterium]|nr:hypothetical protein [Candidatus Saccharimonadales bacterium]
MTERDPQAPEDDVGSKPTRMLPAELGVMDTIESVRARHVNRADLYRRIGNFSFAATAVVAAGLAVTRRGGRPILPEATGKRLVLAGLLTARFAYGISNAEQDGVMFSDAAASAVADRAGAELPISAQPGGSEVAAFIDG